MRTSTTGGAFILAIAMTTSAMAGEPSGMRKFLENSPEGKPCADRAKAKSLLVQLFRNSKKCASSTTLRGGTDCVFTAGKTVIRVAGATDGTSSDRAAGVRGSGFYVDAVDSSMTVRPHFSEEHGGLVIRVDRRDATTGGCVYDDAFISLDSRVTGGAEWGEDP